MDDNLYRSHPSFHKKGCWYDWACFQWQEFDKPVPTRIMMIIGLSGCDIIHNIDQDPDAIIDDANHKLYHI